MARPAVSEATEELYDAFDPAFTIGDEDRGWPLLLFLSALVAGDVDRIHSYVTDSDRPGWQIVFDPDAAPPEVLPYLAQFAGARLRPDMDETQVRSAIKDPEVFHRGHPDQIVAIAKRRLTGSQTVILTERYTDQAYRMQITTLDAETPDPALTLADILAEAKPIGIRLFMNTTVPWTYGEVDIEEATYTAVAGDFASYFELRTHVP